MVYFFLALPQTLLASFKGKKIYFHLAAILLTVVIVLSGFDWTYFTITRASYLRVLVWPAVTMGGILPTLMPLYLVLRGIITRNRESRVLGWVLAEAAMAGWLISSAYKVFTGRIHPDLTGTVDITHEWHFGFLREGIFWGWPSSHTAVAFAMVFALIALYPKHKHLKWVALLYALYVGVGVSMTIHWFSEFIAGALIGTAVGIAVGEVYKKKRKYLAY
jgi:membrane-associated phospholipid phosphatase